MTVHSKIPADAPGRHGEYLAAKWAVDNLHDDADIWINLNWLGQVSDIDQLHHHKDVGTFVLEVKGHTIEQITSYSPEATTFSDGKCYAPEGQARLVAQQLNSWLENKGLIDKKLRPWIHSTVWWPQISRASWNQKFESSASVENSFSMIFKEDMVSQSRFLERLEYILKAPLRGQVGPASANASNKFDEVRELLRIANGLALPDDDKRATLLAARPKTVKKVSEFPYRVDYAYKVALEGYPGTGKTASLLEIARIHASAGANVLYVCFNKTLAAEIRQEVLVRGDSDPIPWSIQAVHMHELYSIETGAKQRDGSSALRALHKIPQGDRSQYDTVLIDEGQDLPDEDFRFLREITTPTGSWFVVNGVGQHLYRQEPAAELASWLKTATTKSYKSSFRSAAGPVLVAQATYRFFDEGFTRAQKWLSETIKGPAANKAATPTPLEIFSSVESAQRDQTLGVHRRNLRERAGVVICSELYPFIFESDKKPDVLILVLGKTGLYARIIEALEESGYEYLDWVASENRNEAPPGRSIRLCTYHSARGLTAENVLVFEYENLKKTRNSWSHRNLANIVLSRATKSTKVVVERETSEPHVLSLEQIINFTTDLLATK